MKTILRTCLLTSLAIQTSHAATILTVTKTSNRTSSAEGSVSEGTIAVTTAVVDSVDGPQTLIQTISGLTLDDTGTGDDSVDITFTATDTTGANAIRTNPTVGFLSSGGVRLNQPGEFIQLAYTDMSVNVSGGTDNGFGEFLGFTQLYIGTWAVGDEALVNGISKTFDGGDGSPISVSGNTLKLEHVLDPDTQGFRMEEWSFQLSVSAVPEPSSTALLGLGGLAFMLRRKRS